MYIVEGNIGVGKSTFIRLINKLDSSIGIVPEPVENWTGKEYGQSLLAEFYKNPSRWAYTLETLAMMSRVKNHLLETKNSNPFRLMERSVYSGHYCFAKNDKQNKYLSSLEWQIYNSWIDFMIRKKLTPPLGFIYLQAKPEICYDRVVCRNRKSEKELSLDYMKQIHNWHERFLVKKEDLFENIKNAPVLVLDCNEDFLNNKDKIKKHTENIKAFMFQTTSCTQQPTKTLSK
ncbi:deoxynucleoside kinase [Candidatus Babeliales bacterium]|nr:deoxynucleoside kinase [Candidatus Babeliales bacterium]